jgi:hypothetical protein
MTVENVHQHAKTVNANQTKTVRTVHKTVVPVLYAETGFVMLTRLALTVLETVGSVVCGVVETVFAAWTKPATPAQWTVGTVPATVVTAGAGPLKEKIVRTVPLTVAGVVATASARESTGKTVRSALKTVAFAVATTFAKNGLEKTLQTVLKTVREK